MRIQHLLLAVTISLALVVSAGASPVNQPPPAGAILDLNGLPIPHASFQTYTIGFTAALTNTDVTFAFREDPSFISFENASIVDTTTSSGNLFTNGDFTGGVYTSSGNPNTPVGWNYANVFGASFGGVLDQPCPNSGGPTTNCWFDGAVQAYDAIDQSVATTIGDSYLISFSVIDNSGLTTFSRVSTNGDVTGIGGNGVDVTVYALAGLPHRAPEPASLLMMGVGLLGLGGIVRRRIRR